MIKVVQEEETIFMVSWIIGTLLTIFYNLENYVNYRSNFEFLQTGFSYIPLSDFFSWVILTLTLANVGLATLLLLDVLFRKIPFKL